MHLLRTILLALLVGAPGLASAADTRVLVGHNRLDPSSVTIAVGDSVTFYNVDAMPGGHTVVAGEQPWKSPPLDVNQTWSHTFEEAGTYKFHIEQHPSAQATVVVE